MRKIKKWQNKIISILFFIILIILLVTWYQHNLFASKTGLQNKQHHKDEVVRLKNYSLNSSNNELKDLLPPPLLDNIE